jgi:predicted Holliday junction resolvase-like endonuclease
MGDSNVQLLLLIAAIVALILWAMYYGLKKRFDSLSNEHNTLKVEMNERAQQQFAAWREAELASARAEVSEVYRLEAETEKKAWKIEMERSIREDAIRRASAVVSGKVAENLAPLMPAFPYDPRDSRFLGSPIDFIVFDGMTENELREIVFLEVKMGSSSLSARERRVRNAVRAKRVSWHLLELGKGTDGPAPLSSPDNLEPLTVR